MKELVLIASVVCVLAADVDVASTAEATNLFSGKIEVELPNFMTPMDEEMRILKFPYLMEERSAVFGDEEGEYTIVFQTRDRIEGIDEEATLAMVVTDLESSGVVTIRDRGLGAMGDRRYFFVAFSSRAMDMYVFNMIRGYFIGDEMLLCSFSCPASRQEEGSAIGQETFESMKIADQ